MHRLAALAVALCAFPAAAQGHWLDTFAVPGAYADGALPATVEAVVPDGPGVLVGGAFAVVDGVPARGVARWTGAAWEAFGGGVRCTACAAARVQAVARDAAGTVWVAGRFDAAVQPDGTVLPVEGLARWTGAAWDAPGRLSGTAAGTGPTGHALLVQGASVVVAGDFADVRRPDGSLVGAANVARWTAGAWEPMSQNVPVHALATGAGGRVLSAGRVPAPAPGDSSVAVTAWDGAAWQPVTGALDNSLARVYALHVGSDGVTVGGTFAGGLTPAGDLVPSRNVVRWDGAAWRAYALGLGGPAVRAFARDGAGLLAGGRLSYPSGIIVDVPRGLVRWTGTFWEDVYGLYGPSVAALAQDGARTLVGGQFGTQSGSGDATRRAVNIAVYTGGEAWQPLSPQTGRDGTLLAYDTFPFDAPSAVRIAPDGCGGVHVYSPFGAGPLAAGARFRRWDGAAWRLAPPGRSGLRSPASDGPGPSVRALAAVPGSCEAVVVGGSFSGASASGFPGLLVSVNVILWNGTAWQALGRGVEADPPSSYDSLVEAVAVQPDGTVVVGGSFGLVRQADGTTLRVNGVARWTAAGGWTALGEGLFNIFSGQPRRVRALLAEADGSIIAGGRFDVVTDSGSPFVDGVARWTGTRWEPLATPLPVEGSSVEVAALARWNGLLVVGGAFAQIRQSGGARLDARNVAAWDGAAWRALPGLTTPVSALAVVDGVLVASDGLAGQAARWTGTAWVPLGERAPRGAAGLVAIGRRLYAAGTFETAGVGSPGLAVYDLDAPVSTALVPAEAEAALRVYPNPSRTSATLAFRLDAPGAVRLVLLDALGRTVAVLLDGPLAAGEQTVRADVSRLPAGVYLARVEAGGSVRAQRVTVVR